MTVWLGIEFRLTAVFPQLIEDVMSFSPDVGYCWGKSCLRPTALPALVICLFSLVL